MRWDKAHNNSFYQFTTICKLHGDFKHSLHFAEGKWVDVDSYVGIGMGPSNRPINFDTAQINHYYVRTLPEWKLKMKKTRAEGKEFKNQMNGFVMNNHNDVEDLHALKFFKDELNNIEDEK